MFGLLEELKSLKGTISKRVAIISPHTNTKKERALTFEQLLDNVEQLRGRLDESLPPPGAIVAIMMPNGIEFVVTFLAIVDSKRVAAPLNPAFKQEEFIFYMKEANVKAAVIIGNESSQEKLLWDAAKSLKIPVIEILLERQKDTFRSTDLLLDSTGYDVQLVPSDTALVLHTSGTTGMPKLVPIKTGALYHAAKQLGIAYKISPLDRTLIVMPLFHVHGLVGCLLTSLLAGSTAIIPERFSAHDFISQVENYRITWLSAVPTIFQILLTRPEYHLFSTKDTNERLVKSHLRFLRTCSAPLSTNLAEKLHQAFNVPILQAYGMTEAAHLVATARVDDEQDYPKGSVGKPIGCDVAIYGQEDMTIMEPGQIGQVCIKGPGVVDGYAKPVSANQTSFTEAGFFKTGDLGFIDKHGFLFISGRIKEFINRGGEKVNPQEIDTILAQSPFVGEAVTFAIPDEIYGEAIASAIVLQETAREMDTEYIMATLKAHCKVYLAPFKCPGKFIFVKEIPKSSVGKVQRAYLSQAYGHHQFNNRQL